MKLKIGDIKRHIKTFIAKIKIFGSDADADSDWFATVILSFILSVAFIIYGVFSFLSLSSGDENAEVIVDPDRQLINKKVLEETLKKYEDREVEFQKIKTEKPNIIDPSR